MCKKMKNLVALMMLLFLVAGAAHAELVGWWPLDEGSGTTTADRSGKGFHGTFLGEPVWTAGVYGGALRLDGNDAVEIDPAVMDPIERQVTVSFWAFGAEALPANHVAFSAYDAAGQRVLSSHIPWGNGNAYFDTGGAGYNRIQQALPANLQKGEWVFWTFWKDADQGAQKIYVNGAEWLAGNSGNTLSMTGATSFIIGARPGFADGGYLGTIDDFRLYDTALTVEEIQEAMAGGGLALEVAKDPVPAHEAADVSPDTTLSWSAGPYAATHDVYFGTSFSDVNEASRGNPLGVLISQGQAGTTFDAAIEIDQTYYWRVDEVNAAPDNTIYKGTTWSFSAEPFSYLITEVTASASSEDPLSPAARTADGSGVSGDSHGVDSGSMWLSNRAGVQPTWIEFEFDRAYLLDAIWIWNSNQGIEVVVGFGVKDALIETSLDGDLWTPLGGGDGQFTLTQAPGVPSYNTPDVIAGGVIARQVRITALSNHGGLFQQYGLSEVRFSFIPSHAREPQPADGAVTAELHPLLDWRGGRGAVEHQVHLASDPDAVLAGSALVATTSESAYDTSDQNFQYGGTYYWKADEIAADGGVMEGSLWSFTTQSYFVVDDFERYGDESPDRPFQTWIDGLGYSEEPGLPGNSGNGSGAIVGHDIWSPGSPYFNGSIMETANALSGQAMPFYYDNSGAGGTALYSEIARRFSPAQNWTAGGVDTLLFNYYAPPISFAEIAPGSLAVSGAGADIWNTADEFRFVWKELIGDGTISARVDSLRNTDPWAKAGVMVRETLEAGSTWASVFSSAENGVRYQARLNTAVAAVSDTAIATPDQIAQQQPVWVRIQRSGSQLNGFYSQNGQNWTAMSWNPQNINMAGSVRIGLAVTSHSPGTYTIAEFSNITTEGNVTGQWQQEEVGVPQPGNEAGPLYVSVNGTRVMHPDADALTVGRWQAWEIPLSAFGGANLSAVNTFGVGVGNPANPQAGGRGVILLDDLRVGKSAD